MNDSLHSSSLAPAAHPVLLRAEGLVFSAATGARLFDGLSFEIRAGLTFIGGGEGRGKTALLRLLAGVLTLESGTVTWQPAPGHAIESDRNDVFLADFDADANPDAVASRWLHEQSARFAGWDRRLLDDLVDGFALTGQLDKTLSMLSTGSRRKVMLAAAFASGARLTLLEKPFAALDARSRGLLTELLQEAAGHRGRAWVLADYLLPAAIETAGLAAALDLGD